MSGLRHRFFHASFIPFSAFGFCSEAQKKMGEASILEMYFDMLPKAVANASAPLTNVDKIVQYGDGNNTKMISDIMGVTTQVMEAMNESGIDVKSLLSGAIGGKIASKD